MPPQEMAYPPYTSTMGFKYPLTRGNFLDTGDLWLEGKRLDDGAENLWRICDKLYDFTKFIDAHPGGSNWLKLTKGTDITEAFEAHHLSSVPENLISNYFVREASTPRNSPFTFKDDGFYRTLKRRVCKILKDIPDAPAKRSQVYADVLLVFFVLFSLLAARLNYFIFGTIAGIFLALLGNAAHNFFHKKDNFRMYYFNFTLMSYQAWRITHALSHHLYPNTVLDWELSVVEPVMQYLPHKKSVFVKLRSWVLSPFQCSITFLGHFMRMIGHLIVYKNGWHPELFLPFILVIAMLMVRDVTIMNVLGRFVYIQIVGSLYFTFSGVNAGHHHPMIFHDGDAARSKEEMDWGVHQMDTTVDRDELIGSHFLVLTTFGDHTLHHLFPTVDHGYLDYLYPILQETCKEFGIEYRRTSQMKLVIGNFTQLIKEVGRKNPPKPLKKM